MPVRLHSESSSPDLDIGLVNNMPDKAIESTERQFMTLIDSAAGGIEVRLSLYALPDVPRKDFARDHIGRFYNRLDSLWNRRLDGLIVTGTEPRAANLRDEPYWLDLTRLIDWAAANTSSSIWSCLAAHAAVLHMDGIARRRLPQKRFGLFEFDRVSNHQLTAGIPARVAIPHSRGNDLPEDQLAACGYTVLTRAQDAGADAFAKQLDSLFVFFQGHPEYGENSLLLEYSRDVGRYLRKESDSYPPIPRGYFDSETIQALTALQERGFSNRCEELLTELPALLTTRNLANHWHSSASRLYANWLQYLCARKEQRNRKTPERHLVAERRLAAGD
jgi:homoserine O-succinyltransferase/O-acetyltransferase